MASKKKVQIIARYRLKHNGAIVYAIRSSKGDGVQLREQKALLSHVAARADRGEP